MGATQPAFWEVENSCAFKVPLSETMPRNHHVHLTVPGCVPVTTEAGHTLHHVPAPLKQGAPLLSRKSASREDTCAHKYLELPKTFPKGLKEFKA